SKPRMKRTSKKNLPKTKKSRKNPSTRSKNLLKNPNLTMTKSPKTRMKQWRTSRRKNRRRKLLTNRAAQKLLRGPRNDLPLARAQSVRRQGTVPTGPNLPAVPRVRVPTVGNEALPLKEATKHRVDPLAKQRTQGAPDLPAQARPKK